jgi:type II secretory pathway pseudopilin PulG
MKTIRQHQGMALIELIVFIVVVGIVCAGVLKGIEQSLIRSNDPNKIVQANYLANARMQVILLERGTSGVSGLADPCATNAFNVCAPLYSYASSNGFTVSSSFSVAGNNTTITINVTGSASTALVTVVSNYGS